MDSFELNKVAGAVLGTLLFAFGTGFLAELIYEPKPAGKAGYALPGGSKEHGGEGGGEAAEKKPEGIATLLASADPEKGKGGSKACAGCHSLEKGGGNKIGPHLWDVVERKKGEVSDFSYSAGLKEKGGTWTYDDLDHFLTKPSEYIKGTKMSFQGISSAPDRANVIAYLRTLSDSPKPLPEAGKKDEGKKDEAKKDEGKKESGEAAAGDGFAAKVASADPKKGEAEIKPCQACHGFDKGGPNKTGPNLYGVVGRKKGSHEGFDYSAGMKEKGGEWSYDDLNQFLTKPADYVKGTKMAFQGVSSEEKRAQIVAYLRTLAETPKPLPGGDKAAEKKDEGAKPAEKATEGDKKAEKPAEAKPEGEKKPEEAKPSEGEKDEKPAEAKPEGGKKAEESKPAEGEKKSEEAKPAEGEKKPEDSKPAEKPAEEKAPQ